MDSSLAQRVMESLRKGIPADGFIRHFTVGRKAEIDDLKQRLQSTDGTVLLLKANYGSGKTHLLRYIREEALHRNYAVSTVTLDSDSAVRFNRMDQILGAVCRNIEIPFSNGQKGIRPFFNTLIDSIDKRDKNSVWHSISNNWRWDYSEELDSAAMFVALRAWATKENKAKDLVEDWLSQPWQYKSQRKKLHQNLVEKQRKYFRDPRQDWMFYADDVFVFHPNGYEQSWAALRDLDKLARAAGLKGMVILFDEYEDVITNLRNIQHQESAFWNLFHFYGGKRFPGKTFYAVTPAFAKKCKKLLLEKERWDFDFSRFSDLPTYEMSPLTKKQLNELALKILEAHGVAYSWSPKQELDEDEIENVVRKAASLQIQDRARHVIKSVVEALDSRL